MSKYLVIVESPKKTKSVGKFLDSSYEVIASVGHIRDLDKKKLGIDIDNNFETTYRVLPDKKDVVKKIIEKAKKSDLVYLASDLDREGEAIAYSIRELLPKTVKTKRITYNSIDKNSILNAIKNAGDINYNLVDAYECRRILDRLVGFKCSFLTKQATGGTSAGRVQSSALRVLAEREKEIQSFIPVKYWDIEAKLATEDKDEIYASIKTPKPIEIDSEEKAKKICDVFKKEIIHVSKFDKKETNSKPYAPFTTSSLLQSASSIFNWSSKKTSSVAQSLYQNAYITYIRTDSIYIIPDKIDEIRKTIENKYGSTYIPAKPNVYSNKKGAQEAHEAIRPIDFSVVNISGGSDEKKLYKMIYKRALSSQMNNAKFLKINAEFSAKKYTLGANGSKLLFDGWRKEWDYGSISDQHLPELSVGDEVDLLSINHIAKETSPPNRYSEASLIKKLEDLGIGRPSTYKSIIQTLSDRNYANIKKKSFHVSELGLKVSDFLVAASFCFVDLEFTSNMEKFLDQITEGKENKLKILNNFWNQLKSDIENAKKIKNKNQKTDFVCPECKKQGVQSFLLKKHSKFGSFYACEKYSDKVNKCEYTANIAGDGTPEEIKKKELVVSDHDCPKCQQKMVERKSKYGIFYGCPSYPKCNGMRDAEGNEIIKKKKYEKKYKNKKKK